MRTTLRFAQLLLLAWLWSPVHAADETDDLEKRERIEAELQQKFRDGMSAIVDDLNSGSFDKLVAAIDSDEMVERIFGLRLIDPRVKRDFREQMDEDDTFQRFIEAQYASESKDGMRARLLLVESRGDRGRAVVRFDMSHFQVNYLEYELGIGSWNRVNVVDWDNYMIGYSFSDYFGTSLVKGQPNKNAVRKLIDFPNVREHQVFQVIEVLKAARDRDIDRFFQIYDNLDESLKRQRAVLVSGLEATRNARKRRSQRKILMDIDKYHPADPLLALSLLDYYFPDKQYDKALAALMRVKDRLRIDGGVMNARLSSTYLVMEKVDDALAFAERSVAQEPELELGWWAVLRAHIAAEDYDSAIPALTELQTRFDHDLKPETLAKDPSLHRFARSEQYKNWLVSDRDDVVSSDGGR